MTKFKIIEVPNSDGITPTKFEAWGYDPFMGKEEMRWRFWSASNYLPQLRATLERDFPEINVEVVTNSASHLTRGEKAKT